jgi:hypothetical protein
MTQYLIVRHPVQDFATWKPHFDAHVLSQHQHGLKLLHLLRNTENKNDLTIHFEVSDIEKAKQFIHSADLHSVMQKAGVIGTPEFVFLKDAKEI